MKNFIRTHFLAIMLALALVLTACGGGAAQSEAASQSVIIEATGTPSGATVEIADKPTDAELDSSGIYGRVTAVDGTSVTIAAGNYENRHLDGTKPDDAAAPADLPTEPDAQGADALPDDLLADDSAAPDGVDLKTADGTAPATPDGTAPNDAKKDGQGKGGFTETGSEFTLTVSDAVSVTVQSGTQTTEATAADIAVGDILVIDGETQSDGSIIPTAVTIIRTPDAK